MVKRERRRRPTCERGSSTEASFLGHVTKEGDRPFLSIHGSLPWEGSMPSSKAFNLESWHEWKRRTLEAKFIMSGARQPLLSSENLKIL
jgi:hypothetical protein